jgi:hypothetical protein
MKIKFITSDIFSSNNILVRIKPLSSEENIRYSADISSSNVNYTPLESGELPAS